MMLGEPLRKRGVVATPTTHTMSDGETVDDDTGAESMTENGGGNRISKAIRGLWSGNSDSDDTQCVSWGLVSRSEL